MPSPRPPPLLLAAVVLGGGAWAGCGDAPITDGGSSDGGSSDTQTQTDDGFVEPGPIVLDAPPVVALGAHLYVSVQDPVSDLVFELGGEVLLPVHVLQADNPGALFIIPDRLAPGPTMLTVRREHDLRSATDWPIELVPPRFANVTEQVGLAQRHNAVGSPPECAYSHTGLAFGDYDDDGAIDLFVGNVGSNGRLFRNRGDLDGDGLPDYEDVTTALGLNTGNQVSMAMFIDLEGDGDRDLFVGRRGENRVFRNQRVPGGTVGFEDVTAELGLDTYDQRTMGVAFGDYDGDDDLDLYVVNHAYCFPQNGFEIRADDHLYRNDDGVFTEVTDLLDPEVVSPVGFSAAWLDIERDGDVDLVVINDDVGGVIGNPNALWINDGPGEPTDDAPNPWRFTDRSIESGVGQAFVNGMGLAFGDVNGDGLVDLAFSNIGDNRLLLSAGDGNFHDGSDAAGIGRGLLPWGRPSITWASHLWDHDNDGDLDLYFVGGRIKGGAVIPDAMFDNDGSGHFTEQTWAFGLTDPASGKASALVDLDGDGAWELATAAWDDQLAVYQNRSAQAGAAHHWLDVTLVGRGGNREAIGAIVELRAGGRTQTCFHTPRPSLGGGGETACHFGLGTNTEVDSLQITWPDGTTDTVVPGPVDQRVAYVQ